VISLLKASHDCYAKELMQFEQSNAFVVDLEVGEIIYLCLFTLHCIYTYILWVGNEIVRVSFMHTFKTKNRKTL